MLIKDITSWQVTVIVEVHLDHLLYNLILFEQGVYIHLHLESEQLNDSH